MRTNSLSHPILTIQTMRAPSLEQRTGQIQIILVLTIATFASAAEAKRDANSKVVEMVLRAPTREKESPVATPLLIGS
jgi:hypothetical protein